MVKNHFRRGSWNCFCHCGINCGINVLSYVVIIQNTFQVHPIFFVDIIIDVFHEIPPYNNSKTDRKILIYLSIYCCISANLKICSCLPVIECMCCQINIIMKPLYYTVHICSFSVRHIQWNLKLMNEWRHSQRRCCTFI